MLFRSNNVGYQAVIKRAHLEDPGLTELIDQIVAEKAEQATDDDQEITTSLVADIIFQLEKDEARRMILEDG